MGAAVQRLRFFVAAHWGASALARSVYSADPRTDELISDLLRNSLEQIRGSVRDRQHENVGPHPPPDDLSEKEQRIAGGATDLTQPEGPRPPRYLGCPGAVSLSQPPRPAQARRAA